MSKGRSFPLLLSMVLTTLGFQNCSVPFQASFDSESSSKLIAHHGKTCLGENDINRFRSCMDSLVPAMSAHEKQCYYGFQDGSSALSFKTRLANGASLHVVQMDGACGGYFPGSYSILTTDELESSRQSRFQLPIGYGTFKKFLKKKLPQVVDTYLTDFDRTSSTQYHSCNRDYELVYFFYAKNWPFLRYLFDGIVNARQIVNGDFEESELLAALDRHLERIADHVIDHANTSFYHGMRGDFIGWNNLNSEWDAFGNCTFSSAAEPNLYSAGYALYILAKTYEMSKNPKYILAFERGARYWHQAHRSTFFTHLPLTVYGPFSLGGTGYDSQFPDSKGEPPLRYHYHFDDPGHYSLNCMASMAQAMTVAGFAKTEGAFPLPSVQSPGQTVFRNWRELGLQTIAVVAANIQDKNYGYYDITDPKFTGYYTGAPNEGYTQYLDTELTALLMADKYTKKNDYQNLVVRATEEVMDNPDYLKKGFSGFRLSLHGACQIRALSNRAKTECEALFQEYRQQEGSDEDALTNPYILFSITR